MSNTSQASQRITALLDGNSFVEIGAKVTARATDFNLKQTETPSDGVITGVNIGVRILSILLGMLIGVRAGRYFIAKGVAVGGIFALITYILSVILAGGFDNSAMTLYDALACIRAGIISGGICAVLPRK